MTTKEDLLKPPVQARSQETLRRILVATRELLTDRDFSDISVDDIVARAGSSKGSFYQRFRDKESALIYLLREEHVRAKRDWSELLSSERWEGSSMRVVLDAFLDRLMMIYRGHTTFMRAYAGEVLAREGEIRSLSIELNRHVLASLKRLILERPEDIKHPHPERAAAFLLTALITLLPPLFLSPSQELFPEPLDPAILEIEVRHLMKSYLGLAGHADS